MATAAQYVAAQNGAVKLALRDLWRFWGTLNLSDGVAVRRALEGFYPTLLATYGEITGAIAADRFEQLTGMTATMVRPFDEERAVARVRWAITPLFDGEGDARARMRGLTDELVKQSGRSTMIRSSREHNIRYARVPSGADTCTWCLMLASRGAVYHSADTARGSAHGVVRSGKFHADCNCRVEPVRSGSDLERLSSEGYDPASLHSRWQDALAAEEAARKARANTP